MSQYKKILPNGRELIYGFDAPTGGYFWTEFYRSDELPEYDPSWGADMKDEEVVKSRDGITLSELVLDLGFSSPLNQDNVAHLLNDFQNHNPPADLQIKVGFMFGKDIISMLGKVYQDIETNFLGMNI